MKLLSGKKKYIAVLLLSAIFASSPVFSHSKKTPDFNRLADKLELSDTQKNEFFSIMKSQYEKRKALKETTRDNRKSAMYQHHSEILSALSSVLNEEQLTSFDALLKERRAKFKERNANHKRGG